MKRTLLCLFLVTSLFLPFCAQLLPQKGSVVQARESPRRDPRNRRTASAVLQKKVDRGRGDDLVRVIIQPAGEWDQTLESTVQSRGGRNQHRFRNFHLRAVTIPAKAALALAERQDIAYVSLNREVRTLGHISRTTGAGEVRNWYCPTIEGLDGAGSGSDFLDSGVDMVQT